MRFKSSLFAFKNYFKCKYSDFTDDKNEINSNIIAFSKCFSLRWGRIGFSYYSLADSTIACPFNAQDQRFLIHPKKESSYDAHPYYQVFRDK